MKGSKERVIVCVASCKECVWFWICFRLYCLRFKFYYLSTRLTSIPNIFVSNYAHSCHAPASRLIFVCERSASLVHRGIPCWFGEFSDSRAAWALSKIVLAAPCTVQRWQKSPALRAVTRKGSQLARQSARKSSSGDCQRLWWEGHRKTGTFRLYRKLSRSPHRTSWGHPRPVDMVCARTSWIQLAPYSGTIRKNKTRKVAPKVKAQHLQRTIFDLGLLSALAGYSLGASV